MTQRDEWIPLVEAAQRLGVTYTRAYALALTGQLDAQRRDGRWWVRVASITRVRRARAAACEPTPAVNA